MIPFSALETKLLAFDVDGTLFSSEDIILATYVEAITRFKKRTGSNIEVPSGENIMKQIGLPVKQIFRNLLPILKEEERDSISNDVLSLLCEKIENKEGKIYPGVREGIKELKESGYIICAASNGRRPYIQSILKAYEILPYFEEFVVINYETIKSKGEIVSYYLKKFDVYGQKALMIGDRASDRDAAIEAGVPFAFCSYGHAEAGEISDYSIELSSFSELVKLLKK